MTIKEAMGELTWAEKGQDDNGAYFILTDSKRGFDYEVMLVKSTNEIQVNGAYLKTVPRDIGEFIQMKMGQAMIYGKQDGTGPKEGCPNFEPDKKPAPKKKTESKKETVKKPVSKKTTKEEKKPVEKKEEKKVDSKKEEKKSAEKKPVAKKETDVDKMKKSKKGKK